MSFIETLSLFDKLNPTDYEPRFKRRFGRSRGHRRFFRDLPLIGKEETSTLK